MPCVQTNGMTMHYEERGQGDALILIMGLGADGSLWEPHVRHYGEHFRCIMIDNRGAGQSDKPVGPYAIPQMADDVLGLMDALDIDKAHISGISMGSCIGQEMALKRPSAVQSLTLIATWDKCDVYTRRIFESLRSLIVTSDPVAFNRLLQLIIFTPAYHVSHLDDLLQREVASMNNPHPMPVEAFQAQCDACIAHDTVGRLNQIKVPTLISSGDTDIFTPMTFARKIHAEIAGSELAVFGGSGHTHHWEQLDAFNRRTLDFLIQHHV